MGHRHLNKINNKENFYSVKLFELKPRLFHCEEFLHLTVR